MSAEPGWSPGVFYCPDYRGSCCSVALVARLVRAGLETFIRPGGSCHASVSVPLRRYTTPSLWIHDSRLANTTTTNLGASRSCWQIWRRSHPKRLRHVSQYVDRHEKDCCIPASTVPPLHGQPSSCQASPPHDPSGIGATHAISNSTWTCKWVVGGKSRQPATRPATKNGKQTANSRQGAGSVFALRTSSLGLGRKEALEAQRSRLKYSRRAQLRWVRVASPRHTDHPNHGHHHTAPASTWRV